MDTEETASENYWWIGIALPNDIRENHVRITPIALYDDASDAWVAIDRRQLSIYFPNDGKALFFRPDECKPNRIYQFRLQITNEKQSPFSSDSPSYAKYWIWRLEAPSSLACVLDWTTDVSTSDLPDEFARRLPFEDLPTQCLYIRHGAQIYGPVHIDPTSGRPREYAQSTDRGGQPLIVQVYTAASKALFHIPVKDERMALLYEHRLEEPRGEGDWSLPQVVLKRVLDASKKLTPNDADGRALVDRRIKELASSASERGPEAFKLSLATIQRARQIASHQLAVLAALDEIGSSILGLPALRPQIEAAIAEEKRKREEEIGREVDAQLADERRALAQRRGEVDAAQEQLNALNAEITEAQEQKERLAREFAAFESAVAQRLESLRAEPVQALADLQLISLLLPTLAQHGGAPASARNGHCETEVARVQQPATLLPDEVSDLCGVIEWNSSASTLADHAPTTLRSHWSPVARRCGARTKDMRATTASLLAGFIPAPRGSGASAALRAFGDMFAGGRIWTIPVSVTTLGTSDLFGAVDQATRQFVPAPGALADIALAACELPDDLGLVIFEGFDRVPGMPTYAPLLRHYMNVQRHILGGPAPTPLNLFHPRALAPDDPYAALAQFSWPSNLIIAAILDEAESSFPIPLECDGWLVRPETGAAKLREDVGPDVPTTIQASAWKDWRQEVYRSVKGNEPADFSAALLEAALRALGPANEVEIDALIKAYERAVEEH